MKRDNVRERVIAERKAAGASLQELATEYGVSRERIRQIVKRYNQEHATAPEAPNEKGG